MKKFIMLLMAVSLAAVLAACNGDDSAENKEDNKDKQAEQASKPVEITDEEKVKEDKVVVKINGNDIKGKEYNDAYAQTKGMMSQYNQDVSDKKKLKDQTLNMIIQQELLKQDAKKQGIEVTDKEVKSEFDKVKSQNKEQFESTLKQLHLTEEAYKDQLAFSLTLEKYVDSQLNTKVTDKEIQSYYDQLKKQNEAASEDKKQEMPKLEEIKDQIKSQLIKQKENQQLQAKIQKLKDQAEIKKMI
ncbi:SurA N-terminal domain-containing protein [Virgibacillus doumboii]|uniref:SurA N-terminal domain-containing protein n=1 Tax=Virgibacillus doumboii TaxID=2697503 RepID=UPI0013DFE792|nr:SurA N-terminal domain-containing protein [Virgibacillus doumboii]